MWQYAVLAGGLVLIGFIVWLALRWMRADAKTAAKEGEIIKQIDVSNKVLIAERDAAIGPKTDPKKPDDILGRL